jgi:RNA polymerase sigma factor (sigma-70 family)
VAGTGLAGMTVAQSAGDQPEPDRPESGHELQVCWKAFYAERSGEVYRIVLHTTRDPMLAEEATGEAFFRAFKQWETIDPAKRRAWVIQVALNYTRTGWRTQLRRRAREQRFIEQHPPIAPVDPEQHLLLSVVMTALAGLPLRQRQVMVLRYLADYSPKEIAELLGISPNTVAVHEHRALQQLRAVLDDQEDLG